ncbi:hypothetical protein PR048_008459 [Dryococelus australis]|uniref:Uncharacterized protein n=1 Tax=Dryococelus australis TaxID=614101 RepID=A0ABQ9HX87_9NEOP|nr:hypothetical protein PR048_008459 [Dryococelus australis]
MRAIEMRVEQCRNEGSGETGAPEKTRQPKASSGTIPTCRESNPVRLDLTCGNVSSMHGFNTTVSRHLLHFHPRSSQPNIGQKAVRVSIRSTPCSSGIPRRKLLTGRDQETAAAMRLGHLFLTTFAVKGCSRSRGPLPRDVPSWAPAPRSRTPLRVTDKVIPPTPQLRNVPPILDAGSPPPIRVKLVAMEQRQNSRIGDTGDPRENAPTSHIVRHDSQVGSDSIGNRIRLLPFLLVIVLSESSGVSSVAGDKKTGHKGFLGWEGLQKTCADWTASCSIELSLGEHHNSVFIIVTLRRVVDGDCTPVERLACSGDEARGKRARISLMAADGVSAARPQVNARPRRQPFVVDVSACRMTPPNKQHHATRRVGLLRGLRARFSAGVAFPNRVPTCTTHLPPGQTGFDSRAVLLPDFCMWESRWTMLVGRFYQGSPVSLALVFRRCSMHHYTLVGTQDLDAEKRGSDKGEGASRVKHAIAPKPRLSTGAQCYCRTMCTYEIFNGIVDACFVEERVFQTLGNAAHAPGQRLFTHRLPRHLYVQAAQLACSPPISDSSRRDLKRVANHSTAGFCGLSTVDACRCMRNEMEHHRNLEEMMSAFTPLLTYDREIFWRRDRGWLPDAFLPTFTRDVELLISAQKGEDGVGAMTELPGFLAPSAGNLRTLPEVTAVDVAVRVVKLPAQEHGWQFHLKGACAFNMLAQSPATSLLESSLQY